ncbi:DUF3618 domain-containing protein [Brevibacterium ihuae]|uniref:DUF3618 domain-containing protein n=1 Tax=Brevibacterium ihuae TaxID=1631743 RepID=UPI000C78A0C1|nr:DUF3618 domain-containing protein [Brevibacterium ihuae]
MTYPNDHGYQADPNRPVAHQGNAGFGTADYPTDNANKTPEQIRAEIEQTRRNLGYDVDAMAEKVSPGKAVARQKNKLTDTLGRWKDSIMGSADDAGTQLSYQRQQLADSAHGAADGARDAAYQARDAAAQVPGRIKQGTRGNPLAAGVIALGAGWLIGSLIPASRQEQQLAVQAKDAAQPLMQEAQQVAKDMGQNMQEPAKQAAESVKAQAQSGTETVKSDAQSEADHLKSEAQSSGESVKQTREQ